MLVCLKDEGNTVSKICVDMRDPRRGLGLRIGGPPFGGWGVRSGEGYWPCLPLLTRAEGCVWLLVLSPEGCGRRSATYSVCLPRCEDDVHKTGEALPRRFATCILPSCYNTLTFSL